MRNNLHESKGSKHAELSGLVGEVPHVDGVPIEP